MASSGVLLAKLALSRTNGTKMSNVVHKNGKRQQISTNAKNVRVKSFDICRCCNFPVLSSQWVSGAKLEVGWMVVWRLSIVSQWCCTRKLTLPSFRFLFFLFSPVRGTASQKVAQPAMNHQQQQQHQRAQQQHQQTRQQHWQSGGLAGV